MSGVAPMRRGGSVSRSRIDSSDSISSERERPVSPQLCSHIIDCLSKTASSILSCCSDSRSEYTEIHQERDYGTFETQSDMANIEVQLDTIDPMLDSECKSKLVSGLCIGKPLNYSEKLLFSAMKKGILSNELAIGYIDENTQTGEIEIGLTRTVQFPDNQSVLLVTHNHPNNGLPLSEPDLRNTIRLGLREVRAVANNNGVFSIKFNDVSMSTPEYVSIKSSARSTGWGKAEALNISSKIYDISNLNDSDVTSMLRKFIVEDLGDSSFSVLPETITNIKKSSFLKNLVGCMHYFNVMKATFSFSPIENSRLHKKRISGSNGNC